jgi:hypothetical protein
MKQRAITHHLTLVSSILVLSLCGVVSRQAHSQSPPYVVKRTMADKSDRMTKDLKDLTPIQPKGVGNPREAEPVHLTVKRGAGPALVAPKKSYYQSSEGPAQTTELLSSFEGIGKDLQFSYNKDKFRVRSAPPDTNGAVGEEHYVQWVNTSFAVFEKKSGRLLYGPVEGKTLWQNFDNGACQNNNDGDPIVQYDKINKRWILAQFSFGKRIDPNTNEITPVAPFNQCIAVSETSDALGKYRRFRFSYDHFNDYPKFGVWADGYYATFNMFGGQDVGSLVCAYDTEVMLGKNTQRPASQQCVQLSSDYFSLLPADIDGRVLPPKGAPQYLLSLDLGKASIYLWKFHVDWDKLANSTFKGPILVAGVDSFDIPCTNDPERLACIKQRGTEQVLESLADRLMYRLAYRHIPSDRRSPGYEALVFNHAVATSSGSVALRWYEMRGPFDSPMIYQSGTFAPDSNSRWVGSIAMDKLGNIGIGYTVSGSNMSPAIYFTGREPSDPQQGRLQKETPIVNNGGSQTCILPNGQCYVDCQLDNGECLAEIERWGDYSSLTIDPDDDCTMWYTSQYLKSDGGYNWNTKIAKFKFKSCK